MSAVPVVAATGVTATAAPAPATPTSCKFSLTLARNVHRIKKMLKPVLEMVHRRCRKSSRKSQQQQQCSQSFEDDEAPADQNAANEALEQRLAEELRAGAAPGAAVAVWCDGRVRLRQVAAVATQGQVGAVSVPASFLSTAQGGLCWVTPDADILLLAGSHESQGLAAEQQAPAALLSTPSSSQETLSVHSF